MCMACLSPSSFPLLENECYGADLCSPAAKVYSFVLSFHLQAEKEEAAGGKGGKGEKEWV